MANEDRVAISLGGGDLRILQSYEVSQRFFTTPSAFSVRIGSGAKARELITAYPPNTAYTLVVGDVPQHTGRTDGYAPEGSQGATEINLRGRDCLAPLHDACITEDKSFSNLTFLELTIACLEGAGITGYSINSSNSANRQAISNDVKVRDLFFNEAADAARAGEPVVHQKLSEVKQRYLRAKVGSTWGNFLKKELDRAGLFLFAGVDENNFVLSEPKPKQSPIAELVRQRGAQRNFVNVLSARHQNETTQRFSEYIVYGRGGGGKGGRAKAKGAFADEEMAAYGITRPWAIVDDAAKTSGQAEFLARKKCAEDRRHGWNLTYTVRGHTAPIIDAKGRRCVWSVDTVVTVRDDELGINRDMWIEGVTMRGGLDGTTTELTLLRGEDLVFGEAAAQ